MQRLHGKHILLGITGGIAAYKSADLCSRLKKTGAEVRVMMTGAATEFVSAMTFQALSGKPVYAGQNETGTSNAMDHIELARWADVIVIAPASANTIAKLAQGRADNLLTTTCLASNAVKCFAPAMNRVMWEDASTQKNCQTLLDNHWYQFGPDSGPQACGEIGEGRMQEVDDILNNLKQCFSTGLLQGINVTVTAGPTHEAIDPVRYIGNRSSGRMGYALARAAQEAGANVSLISGPCHLSVPEKVSFINIETAADMQQVVMQGINSCDIYISAAAIADYRVKTVATEKIKKQANEITLTLVKNPDIISLVATLEPAPFVVGFAAETEKLEQFASEKLLRKKLDMIIANDVSPSVTASAKASNEVSSIGFNSPFNAVTVFSHEDDNITQQFLPTERKTLLAKQLIEIIARQFYKTRQKKTAATVSSSDNGA